MGLNKYQKGDFTSLTMAIYQKSVFYFLNPFTNISNIQVILTYGIYSGSFLDNLG